MSDHEFRRPRYFFAWGIIALLVLVAVSVGLSAYFWATRPLAGAVYPFYFFPFFPFFGLFWIFIIFFGLKFLFWPWRWHYSRRYWRYGDDAYQILRARYARGEITKDQFDQMMRDLEQHA